MGRIYDKLFRPLLLLCGVFAVLSLAPTAAAHSFGTSKFGQCKFGLSGTCGALTSLSIALGGNVTVNLSPSGATFVGSGSHTLTVTTTDSTGYKLYIYSPGGTNMTNGSYTIAASSNTVAGALSTNSWGYNTDGSSNYLGMLTTPALLKEAAGSYGSGDNTTVTYGVKTDITKGDGSYTVSVTYTAVGINY